MTGLHVPSIVFLQIKDIVKCFQTSWDHVQHMFLLIYATFNNLIWTCPGFMLNELPKSISNNMVNLQWRGSKIDSDAILLCWECCWEFVLYSSSLLSGQISDAIIYFFIAEGVAFKERVLLYLIGYVHMYNCWNNLISKHKMWTPTEQWKFRKFLQVQQDNGDCTS